MRIGTALKVITISTIILAWGNLSAAEHHAQSESSPSDYNAAPSAFFDTLAKNMTGKWEGQYTNGTFNAPTDWDPVRVEYRLTARGTALVEDYIFEDSDDVVMTTVYHRDNEDLRLTHYCGARNHPSMIARELNTDAQRVLFEFTDITNLEKPEDYHSRQMEVTIVDEDHIKIQYHGIQRGERASQAYNLRRAN